MSASTSVEPIHTDLLINGEEVHAGDRQPVHNPAAPDEIVGYISAATVDQATAAVDAAAGAWPMWSAMAPTKRAEVLTTALRGLDQTEARAALLTRENGKILQEAKTELGVFVSRCQLAAALADQLGRTEDLPVPSAPEAAEAPTPSLPPFRSRVNALPVGVTTIIVPYNWPLAILAASLPYALVAGNPVIVKPPPTSPLAVVETLRLLARGLPPGVLNVVTGDNESVAPVIEDRRVQKIVFTGSTSAGQYMMTTAAKNLTRVTLELGGNDPAVVLDDATLDQDALQRLVTGSFLTTGQVCMGIKRLYVHRSRFAEVIDGMSDILSRYRIGNGLDADISMGPLNNAQQRDKVRQLCDEARSAGHEVRELGTIDPDAQSAGGYFLPATVVLDPAPDSKIVTTEQFGPALPIAPFDDENALIDQLNDEWAGLCSSVWSADPERAADAADRLRTGTVWINNHNAVAQDDRAPFGGFRQSGIGRELGVDGLLDFTEPHTVTYSVPGETGAQS